MKTKPAKWLTRYRDHLVYRTSLSQNTINQKILNLRKAAAWFTANNMVHTVRSGEKVRKYGPMASLVDEAVFEYMNYLMNEGRTLDTRSKIKRDIKSFIFYLHNYVKVTTRSIDWDFEMRANGSEGAGANEQITKRAMADLIKPKLSAIHPRTEIIIRLLSTLGIRIHELLALSFHDFESDRIVNIRSTKTKGRSRWGGDRKMILTGDVYQRVLQYKVSHSINSDQRLFPVGRQTIYDLIKDFGKGVDLPWLSPHKFRHYCITQFAAVTQNGNQTPVFTTAELSEMFGVSPKVIVSTYIHPEIDDIFRKAEALGSFI